MPTHIRSRIHEQTFAVGGMDIRSVYVTASSKVLLSKTNDLFLLSHDDVRFTKIDHKGNVVWGVSKGVICKPMDMTTMSNGNILISDEGRGDNFGRIVLLTHFGKFRQYIITGLGSPVGLDCDLHDNVYVCDQLYSCIVVTSRLGFILNVISFHTPPIYVCIGNSSSLFVTDGYGVNCLTLDGRLQWKKMMATNGKCCVSPCGCVCVLSVPDKAEPTLEIFSDKVSHFHFPTIIPREARMLGVCKGVVVMAYPVMTRLSFKEEKTKQLHIVELLPGTCSNKKRHYHTEKLVLQPLQKPSLRSTEMQALDYLDLNTVSGYSKCYHNICKLDLICDIRLQNSFLLREICLAYMKIEMDIQAKDTIYCRAMSRHIYFILLRSFIMNRSPEKLILWSCAFGNQDSITRFSIARALDICNMVSCTDDNGNTPLHHATMKGNELTARLLLSYKANAMIENDIGYTCLELAEAVGEIRIKRAIAWHLSRQLLHFCKETERHRIHDIWPAYKYKEDKKDYRNSTVVKHREFSTLPSKSVMDHTDSEFCIVVLYENIPPDEETLTAKFNRVDIVLRSIFTVSTEAEILSTVQSSDQHHFSKELPSVSSRRADELFSKHSNLTMIIPSPIYSYSYKHGAPNILQKPTLVLFIRIKGVIPIGEHPFPRVIDGYPTDVREGYFSLGVGGGPNDYHQNLKAGCCIGAENRGFEGTAGGFVELDSHDYLITCAHVVHDLRILSAKRERLKTYLKFNTVNVYSPTPNTAPGNQPVKCGTVYKSVFTHGIHHEVSVDASLIKIENGRNPVDGSIPSETAVILRSVGYDLQKPPLYSSGDIVAHIDNGMKGHQLIKFGATTGLTRGLLAVDGCHVRVENKELKLEETVYGNKVSKTFEMYNQHEIESVGNKIFFQEGDSGAFVYMLCDNNPEDLRCIGMAIGITSYRSCIMTPIINVLQELGLPPKLKSFPRNRKQLSSGTSIQNSNVLPMDVHDGSKSSVQSDQQPATSSSVKGKQQESQRLEYCENMISILMNELQTLKSSKPSEARTKEASHSKDTPRYQPYQTPTKKTIIDKKNSRKEKAYSGERSPSTDATSDTGYATDNIPSVSSYSIPSVESYRSIPSVESYKSIPSVDSCRSIPSVESFHENNQTVSEEESGKDDLSDTISQHFNSMAVERWKIVKEFLKTTKNAKPSESDIIKLWQDNMSLFNNKSFLTKIIEKVRQRSEEKTECIIID